MSDTGVKTITAEVDIARSPHEVFGFIADAAHLPEWQPDVRQAAFDEPAAVAVGSRGREVRHVMGSDRPITWEVTDYDPDRRYGVRGVDGPVRAHVTMDLTPTTDGTGTHLEYGIDFEGHPQLVHLYLPEDFEGHPGLKSFKLPGRTTVKPWPGAKDPEEAAAGGH